VRRQRLARRTKTAAISDADTDLAELSRLNPPTPVWVELLRAKQSELRAKESEIATLRESKASEIETLRESKASEIDTLRESKASEIDTLRESKDSDAKSKESEIKTLRKHLSLMEMEKAKAEQAMLVAMSEKNAIMDTRVLLQIAGMVAGSSGNTMTQKLEVVTAMVKKNNQLDGTKLSDDAKVWVDAILGGEAAMYYATICKDLTQVFHHVSKEGVHVLRHVETPGVYIWHKDTSIRVAVAVIVLKAQQLGLWPTTVGPVFVLGAKTVDVVAELRGGSVLPLPSTPPATPDTTAGAAASASTAAK